MKQAGYSVSFYPEKEVVKANGTSPVYVRITNNGECAAFSDIPRAILNKYEGKLLEGQLLPTISNSSTDKYLKIIAAMVGIDKKPTFYTVRYTFAATICLLIIFLENN